MPRQPKATKPPTKAQIWDRFKRLVTAAAREAGVPEVAYSIERVTTRDLRKSEAWKDFERAWAKLAVSFGFAEAERISRGDDLGVSDVDIALPLLPGALVDCKYQAHGWHHETVFEKCEAKYLEKPGDYIIMPTKSGGKAGSLTTVRSEVFLDLLRRAHSLSETKVGALRCLRCAGGNLFSRGVNNLGLCELECDVCQVSVLLRESDTPKAVLSHGIIEGDAVARSLASSREIIDLPLEYQKRATA